MMASPRNSPPREPTTTPGPDRPRADRPVTLAVVAGAHGVGGEVRLKVFADDLGAHRSFNAGSLTLQAMRAVSGGAIARFAGVADRDAAERMRGLELTVPRSALPPLAPGEYYHADLIGLAAVSDAGAPLGHVVAVDNFGAGDVIEIERPDGRRFMVPMRQEAVPRWTDTELVVAEDHIA